MSSIPTKLIPFAVLAIVAGSLAAEAAYGIEIDLESLTPVLVAMGVGGIPLAAYKKAVDARKALPEDIQDLAKKEIAKLIPEKDIEKQ